MKEQPMTTTKTLDATRLAAEAARLYELRREIAVREDEVSIVQRRLLDDVRGPIELDGYRVCDVRPDLITVDEVSLHKVQPELWVPNADTKKSIARILPARLVDPALCTLSRKAERCVTVVPEARGPYIVVTPR